MNCENCGCDKRFHGMTEGIVCSKIVGLLPCECEEFEDKLNPRDTTKSDLYVNCEGRTSLGARK